MFLTLIYPSLNLRKSTAEDARLRLKVAIMFHWSTHLALQLSTNIWRSAVGYIRQAWYRQVGRALGFELYTGVTLKQISILCAHHRALHRVTAMKFIAMACGTGSAFTSQTLQPQCECGRGDCSYWCLQECQSMMRELHCIQ